MEDGAFGGSFGKYDVTTHDQNKKNTGYNNSLYEGSNFSTTLGGNFSTVVGANFSTTGGLTMSTVVGFNMPVTLGGKIELISPWSIKWTRGSWWDGSFGMPGSDLPMVNAGGYDYDFKNCQTQVKWNDGERLFTYNSPEMTDYKIGKDGVNTVDKKKDFAKLADVWLGEQTFVAQSVIQKILQGNMTYGTMTTTVAETCLIVCGGSAMVLKPTGMECGTPGTLTLEGGTDVKLLSKGKIKHNALFINIG